MATAAKKPKNAPAVDVAELPAWEVIGNLEHDGKAYALGDLVLLDDAASAALLACTPPVIRAADAAAA